MHETAQCPALVVVDPPVAAGITLLWVVADLDMTTIPAADRQLRSVLDLAPPKSTVVLDFGLDAFVSARGLGLLLDLSDRLHARGGLLIASTPPVGLRLMVETLDLSARIRAVPTVRDALRVASGR
jgi:anti-anti-sigma regulatory factor